MENHMTQLLCQAVAEDDAPEFRRLLGAAPAGWSQLCLSLACFHGSTAVLRFLLDGVAAAYLNPIVPTLPSLLLGAHTAQATLARYGGADRELLTQPAIITAAVRLHPDAVALLLERGARLPATVGDGSGWRPLLAYWASRAAEGREADALRVLQLLLDAGADPLAAETEPPRPDRMVRSRVGTICSFLLTCRQPRLLAAGVTHVLRQCALVGGRELSPPQLAVVLLAARLSGCLPAESEQLLAQAAAQAGGCFPSASDVRTGAASGDGARTWGGDMSARRGDRLGGSPEKRRRLVLLAGGCGSDGEEEGGSGDEGEGDDEGGAGGGGGMTPGGMAEAAQIAQMHRARQSWLETLRHRQLGLRERLTRARQAREAAELVAASLTGAAAAAAAAGGAAAADHLQAFLHPPYPPRHGIPEGIEHQLAAAASAESNAVRRVRDLQRRMAQQEELEWRERSAAAWRTDQALLHSTGAATASGGGGGGTDDPFAPRWLARSVRAFDPDAPSTSAAAAEAAAAGGCAGAGGATTSSAAPAAAAAARPAGDPPSAAAAAAAPSHGGRAPPSLATLLAGSPLSRPRGGSGLTAAGLPAPSLVVGGGGAVGAVVTDRAEWQRQLRAQLVADAAMHGLTDVLHLLLSQGASPSQEVQWAGPPDPETLPVQEQGQGMEQGGLPPAAAMRSDGERSPLALAAAHGQREAVGLLLRRGAAVGTATLRHAVWSLNAAGVEALLLHARPSQLPPNLSSSYVESSLNCPILLLLQRHLQQAAAVTAAAATAVRPPDIMPHALQQLAQPPAAAATDFYVVYQGLRQQEEGQGWVAAVRRRAEPALTAVEGQAVRIMDLLYAAGYRINVYRDLCGRGEDGIWRMQRVVGLQPRELAKLEVGHRNRLLYHAYSRPHWGASVHRHFPPAFKAAVKELHLVARWGEEKQRQQHHQQQQRQQLRAEQQQVEDREVLPEAGGCGGYGGNGGGGARGCAATPGAVAAVGLALLPIELLNKIISDAAYPLSEWVRV